MCRGLRYTTHGEEKSLGGTGLEELLPLRSVVAGEGDGVGGEVHVQTDHSRPGVQLEGKKKGEKKRKMMKWIPLSLF